MKTPAALLAAALLGSVLAISPATAQISILESDNDYLALVNAGQFTKYFGGEVRWGDSAGKATWEYAVITGTNTPVNQQQIDWSTNNPHTFSFGFNTGTGDAKLQINDIGSGSVGNVGSYVPMGSMLNTLFIRAFAKPDPNSTKTQTASAALRDMRVSFAGGGEIMLGALLGDTDAEYFRLVDSRLAGGFVVTGAGEFSSGSNSNPSYQFKVGNSAEVVPEPISMLLMGTGLAGVAGAARRRRRRADAPPV